MKTNSTLFLILFLLITNSVSGQNLLNIHNPDRWGADQGERGTITEATFTIQPQGAYMDISMFLTISAENTFFSTDLLEIVLDFNLPEGAIVYDSWLWMLDDTTIVKADVLDILSATQDYEDIVDRNLDPSLLYRKPNGSYQIRIFPLPADETRRIKISYLAPAIWSDGKVTCGLPLEILRTSATLPDALQLITFPDETWTNPFLRGGNMVPFYEFDDPEHGEVLVAQIPSDLFGKNIQFSVNSPLQEGTAFVQKLVDGPDKFYQMIYQPPAIPTESEPSNVLFLLDHQDSYTSLSTSDILSEVKKNCEAFIKPSDQWNFLYSSNNGITQLSDQWLDGSPESLFSNLGNLPDILDDASDLFPLLDQGIKFVKETEGSGDIVLVCNSASIAWTLHADSLINLIGEDDIRVHIVNYQTEGFYYEIIWNGPDFYTYPNQTFYTQLTLGTGGTLHGSMEGSAGVWSSIPATLRNIKHKDEIFELQTSMSEGFTYQQYTPAFFGQSQNYDQPIMEVGRFTGEGDLEIEFSGIGDSSFVFDMVTVNESEMDAADSLTREIWMGHQIRDMEAYVSNTGDQQEIIELSKAERVLSKYTAFLALDLEQGAEPCFNCWDYENFIIVNTEELEEKSENITIQTFPNPFTDFVTITIEIEHAQSSAGYGNEAELEIHDRFGRLVYTKNLAYSINTDNYQIVWDGSGNSGTKLPSGIYYLTVKTGETVQTVPVSLVR